MRADGYNRKQMAYTAAAMYGGAAFVALGGALASGGQTLTPAPGAAAFGLVMMLLLVGPRLPVAALATVGPIGAALIAVAIATTPEPGDGAVLYAWPVLWTTYYFGLRGSVLIVAWVAVVHAIAVLSLSGAASSFDRWLDVTFSMAIVAAVVHILAKRNQVLLSQSLAEARTDKLTGLLNRRGFEERVPIELSRAQRRTGPIAVVSFDIDYFKRVNDEWGHEAGDRLLAALGRVFRAETRENDIVARMGGEEFTAVLAVESETEAVAYAERVRAAFAAVDVGIGRTTISAGITTAVAPDTARPLLLAADTALYAAKCAGRDRTFIGAKNSPQPSRVLVAS